jgi:RNA polymerase sigma-70 factor (ECF subfamily)
LVFIDNKDQTGHYENIFYKNEENNVVFVPLLRLTDVTKKKMEKTEANFKKILHDHKSTIYSVCYMFSQEHDEVEDLFQETLINLWNGLDTFEERSSIGTWVWRIALNTCITSERKKKRRVDTVPLSIDRDFLDDNNAESRQTKLLHKRISRLQPFDRAIVLLWLENMSYDDIAAIVGITTKAVGVRLVRIREQLKQMNDNTTN